MRRFVLAGILLCMSTLGLAYDSPVKADSPSRYTVQKGDTLWDISNTFLNSPWMWPEIWHANPQVHNPHLIFPGDVVSLVYINGRPRLMISSRGNTGRIIKLTPKIRTMPGESAIPAIPLSAISSYLKRNRVFDSEDDLRLTPYIVASKDDRFISSVGDKVYARGNFTGKGIKFDVFRQGETIKDLDSGEVLGITGIEVGALNVSKVRDDVASLIIQESRIELRPGDRLVKDEGGALVTTFFPRAPDAPVEGKVTANLTGSEKMSRYDTVVINKGLRESLKQGDLLAVYKATVQVKDKFANEMITLPLERVGMVMVYRPFEKMSYGIVLSAKEDIEIGDILRSPQP